MIGAWQYALSGVDRGMTATAGLEDFRAGGGSIRTADWYHLASEARGSFDRGEAIRGQLFDAPIPSVAHTTVDYDYGKKYITIADVSYYDAATGDRVNRSVTVESNEIRPWSDIQDEIESVVVEYGTVGGAAGVTITRATFSTPAWMQIPFE